MTRLDHMAGRIGRCAALVGIHGDDFFNFMSVIAARRAIFSQYLIMGMANPGKMVNGRQGHLKDSVADAVDVSVALSLL